MARAYAYANSDGPMPQETRLANLIRRFGAESIYGRPLGANEIRRMEMSESVIDIYQERELSGDWGAWAESNPEKSKFLNWALKCAVELGMIDDR